jgi:uncharacterized hydrophobic protein (TIGR00271 family)
VKTSIYRMFSLRRDQQDADVIDDTLRTGAEAVGTNLWVLFFAILIASVGLNVNSTAVIIGAMLISPLMGPIVGIGYAAAVADFPLIRASARNLLLFTGLSLLTSVIYFTLSPLDEPQSELLARTSPTLWDVLIAAFGGAAGMVAVTRKSFSNIVPGVAIATALMPPLCTAGFGLANGRWDMFAGAFYLYLINGVFIAAATLGMAKLLRLPARGEVDAAARRRHRIILFVGLTVVLVPSVWLGYRFVQHEVFANAAGKVGRVMLSDSRVLSYDVDAPRRQLRLTALGDRDHGQLVARAQELLDQERVQGATVSLRRAGERSLDVNALRKDLVEELQRTLVAQVQSNDTRLRQLQSDLEQLTAATAARGPETAGLAEEIRAQLPQVSGAWLAAPLPAGPTVPSGAASGTAVAAPAAAAAPAGPSMVVISLAQPLPARERERLAAWLAVRLSQPQVIVVDYLVRQPARP